MVLYTTTEKHEGEIEYNGLILYYKGSTDYEIGGGDEAPYVEVLNTEIESVTMGEEGIDALEFFKDMYFEKTIENRVRLEKDPSTGYYQRKKIHETKTIRIRVADDIRDLINQKLSEHE